MKNVSICLVLREIPTNPTYLSIGTVKAISSCLSVIATVLIGFRFYHFTAFHWNVQALYIYNLIDEKSPCSLIYYAAECSWLNIPLITCIIGFILIQAAFTIERLIATYRLGNYERRGKYVGPIMAVVVALLSAVCARWGLGSTDPNELQFFCAAIPNSSTSRMSLIYMRFRLELRYEIQENLKVLRILFPIAITHFLVFGIFMLGNVVVRSFREKMPLKIFAISMASVHIMPYYFLILSTWIYVVLRRESLKVLEFRQAIARPERNKERDVYFDSLQKQCFEEYERDELDEVDEVMACAKEML
ncbi:unnamed protein product [Cylicocyclus nassatus]|uniref:G protein-coupled receptor n=1 Tax=Cylicocyclus nassatus TaxID=53992 RepID=A0AA36MEX0_CYLNA|nr:unnamed protein product [Cylicocyclus nassatus]